LLKLSFFSRLINQVQVATKVNHIHDKKANASLPRAPSGVIKTQYGGM